MGKRKDAGPQFVTKDDLIELAFSMRDAQNAFYRGGRHEKDKLEAMSLEKRFDTMRMAYLRGLNVAPPLAGFSVDDLKPEPKTPKQSEGITL